MAKYRLKQSPVFDAVQWFPDKPHPMVKDLFLVNELVGIGAKTKQYGMLHSGLLSFSVEPGDWIVITHLGEYRVYSPRDFKALYEPA